jgi:hypothetical protein
MGLSELILSGILFTLMGIAYQVGQFTKELRMTVKDHERRISRLEKVKGQ